MTKQGGKMVNGVCEALAEPFDTLPTGFSRTENGSEMRILRRLFTSEDAELAVHITAQLQQPEEIAKCAGTSVEAASHAAARDGIRTKNRPGLR